MAQFSTNGYYRVQNAYSTRYVSIIDSHASASVSTTDVDLAALYSLYGFDRAVSNPATVIYIQKETDGYILKGQGINTYSMVGVYLQLIDNGDGTYKAYATSNGMTKYLTDEAGGGDEYGNGEVGTGKKTSSYSNWNILPITTADGRYFGITPELTLSGKGYATLYGDFPFALASEGMTAYYVSKVDNLWTGAVAVITPVTDNVPANTAVLLECTGADASANRCDIGASATAISGNNLSGVYFCNDVTGTHRNVTAYNASTMRILGTTSDGSLGFVTADIDYLPANKAYLTVPATYPAELKIVTEEEYAAGINGVTIDSAANTTRPGVYTLTGLKVSATNELPANLPAGVYIVAGKKYMVK